MTITVTHTLIGLVMGTFDDEGNARDYMSKNAHLGLTLYRDGEAVFTQEPMSVSRVTAREFLENTDIDPETAIGVVNAAIIARARAHWQKFSEAYIDMHTADTDAEVAELSRRMAAELNTYAIYRDAMAARWEGEK